MSSGGDQYELPFYATPAAPEIFIWYFIPPKNYKKYLII